MQRRKKSDVQNSDVPLCKKQLCAAGKKKQEEKLFVYAQAGLCGVFRGSGKGRWGLEDEVRCGWCAICDETKR